MDDKRDQDKSSGRFLAGNNASPGRPRKIPRYVAKMRALEPKIFARLERIIEHSTREGDVVAAAKLALGYGRGNPKQGVELSGPGGGPIQVIADVDSLRDPAVRAHLQAAALLAAGPALDPGGSGGDT